ncbi:MAG TPA: DUF4430 domain-containing protein [Verrucomicrobiae bacterium]|nr:DUF4430 domain-containing protein [Verrucomicrobiae bacterium]
MIVWGVKISKKAVVSAMAALVVAGIGTFALLNRTPSEPATALSASKVQKTASDSVSYVGKKGVTALAQLKETASGVVTKSSSYGEYVDAIGDFSSGKDGKYWTFYVDGKLASVGAGAYLAKGGEKIEWKFEKAQ